MPNNETTTIGPISGFIPQIFFDFIARVIPGAFLLLCAHLVVFHDPANFNLTLTSALEQYKQQEGVKFIIFTAFLFAAYVFSIILEGIYRIFKMAAKDKWNDILSKQINKTNGTALEYLNKKHSRHFETRIFPDIFIMYDSIRLKNPSAGSRLVKLRAEYYMA